MTLDVPLDLLSAKRQIYQLLSDIGARRRVFRFFDTQLTFKKSTSGCWAASCSYFGATILQGPHHVAVKSTCGWITHATATPDKR